MRASAIGVVIVAMMGACSDDGGGGPVGPVADGTIGPWVAGPVMPVARGNHASVIMGDDLIVIGGNHRESAGGPFVRTDRIDAAAIGEDGALAAWRQVGTLGSPVSEPAAAVWGDTLLVIDGLHDDESQDGQVWAATRGADGMLGAFVSLGALPPDRRAIASEAYVAGDTLYVTSGTLPNAGDTLSLLTAQLGTTPLVWNETVIAPAPGWRGQPQFVFTGDSIHALGGYLGGTVQVVPDVQWARLAGGVATPAPDETPLPAPIAAGEAVAVDDYAFVVGGKPMINGSMGQTGTWVTTIAPDGALGAWTAATPLPAGRSNHDLVVGPTHLYVTGGSLDMGGLDTVFYAQVRFAIAE